MLSNTQIRERVLTEKKLYKASCKEKGLTYHEEDFTDIIEMTPETLKKFATTKGYPKLETLIPIVNNLCYDWNTFLEIPYSEQTAKTQDVADVCEKTGLSETAVKKLEEWNNCDDRRRQWASFISFILEHESCEKILSRLSNIMGLSKFEGRLYQTDSTAEEISGIIDMQVAESYYIMTLFQRVIDDMSITERMKVKEDE